MLCKRDEEHGQLRLAKSAVHKIKIFQELRTRQSRQKVSNINEQEVAAHDPQFERIKSICIGEEKEGKGQQRIR